MRWRRRAVQLFPERAEAFERARGVLDILFSLKDDLKHESDGKRRADLEGRFVRYVSDSLRPADSEQFKGTIINTFLVHLGAEDELRDLLPKCVSADQFKASEASFERTLTEEDYQKVVASFVAAKMTRGDR
jgi:hypothetical protein